MTGKIQGIWHAVQAGFVALVLGSGVGCAVLDVSTGPPLIPDAKWAVLTFENLTETPQAGRRVEAITTGLLLAMGVKETIQFDGDEQGDVVSTTPQSARQQAALSWAKSQNARYAVLGSVDEWRYKVGIDGEPAVGVTIQVVDLSSGQVVWSGVGAKAGWGREALSAVAQKLIRKLLEQARLQS